MGTMVVGVLMAFVSLVTVSMWGLNAQKKLVVGSTGMVASIILYGSPLSDIRTVVRTKSVECMSFYFSLFAFLGSVLWLVYGALSKDILIMAPNFFGIPLASVQMIIYCMYKRKKRLRVEAEDGKVEVVIVVEEGKVEVVTVVELESVEDKSLAMTKFPAFPSS
ncbi:bidirectional sugar transporter SWEET3b-like [Cryptomeria japonica]|uniref:bidirectional sugar transporter SWEET3b-like n=1 Tax=Cryptomeria japonica TaxID=3369 RepID=UPI0025AB88F9|nr:bidirectional sugar transporter SWEET3b-like [Cryptomeria japonica]